MGEYAVFARTTRISSAILYRLFLTISKVAGSAWDVTSCICFLFRSPHGAKRNAGAGSRISARVRGRPSGLRSFHHHETILIHPRLPGGRDQDGGFERLDHRRSLRHQSGGHARAIEDERVDLAARAKPQRPARLDRIAP